MTKSQGGCVKGSKKMADVGNTCLKRNADVLLSKLGPNTDILWPGERIPEERFALTY